MKNIFVQFKKGGALIYGLIMVGIVSVIFTGLIQFVVSQLKYSLYVVPREQSLHIAEAGVYFYRWYLAHNVEGRTATQVETFWSGNPLGVDDNQDGDCDDADLSIDDADIDGDGDIDGDDSDGTEAYVVDFEDYGRFSICVTRPPVYSTIVTITASGWTNQRPTLVRTVSARLRKPSWSENAILANAATRLSAGTEVYGPMHVNGGFRFDGVAHNVVSSSVTCYDDPDTTGVNDPCEQPGVWTSWAAEYNTTLASDVFLAGKTFPVTATDFDNVTANFNLMREIATTNLLYWGTQGKGRLIELGVPSANQMRVTRVQQYNASTYEITNLQQSDVDDVLIPDFGVVYVEDNVWVVGTLPSGKQLTIAAHHSDAGETPSIFLGMDDIFYEAGADSSTVLGLAAEGSVSILRDAEGSLSAASGTDLETLHIDGALLAQTGNVGWSSPNGVSWNTYKDTIEIFGAIATNTRMGFGYSSGTGYANRNLIFDNSLLQYPPPLFPTGDSYLIDQWAEIE